MLNAHEWTDHIVDTLFAADKRRIGTIVTRLVRANNELKGQRSFGFTHMGKKYLDPQYAEQAKTLMPMPMPSLAFELMAELKEFDVDIAQLEHDKAKVKQALAPLLINCTTMQDIRNSMPECIIHKFPQLSELKRTNEDNLLLIRNDRYSMRAYEQALPLIQAYSVADLIC